MAECVPRHVVETGLVAGLLQAEPEVFPPSSGLEVVENVFTFAQATPALHHTRSRVVQWDFQHAPILPYQHFDDGVLQVHLLPFQV